MISGGRSNLKCRKHAAALMSSLALLSGPALSGCSPSNEDPPPPSSSPMATSSSTAQPSATATPARPTPPVGIVVQSHIDGFEPEIGVIDPTTGEYTEIATFDLPAGTSGLSDSYPRNVTETAPDYQRLAITTREGAGWMDRFGKFTNVNAEAAPGPFGGSAATYRAIGFNGRGDFFYERSHADSGREVYRLPSGQTGTGLKEPTTDLLAAWITRDGNGELVMGSTACLIAPGSWVSPTEYVFGEESTPIYGTSGKGTQIYRTSTATGACASDQSTALLPEANTSQVSNPIVSPDGASVAFLRNRDEIWITNTTGGAEPRQLVVKGTSLDFSNANLIGWTRA